MEGPRPYQVLMDELDGAIGGYNGLSEAGRALYATHLRRMVDEGTIGMVIAGRADPVLIGRMEGRVLAMELARLKP